ncbi:MAG: M48 family metallopeptidase [Candidatus Helarchaeota archaeon]
MKKLSKPLKNSIKRRKDNLKYFYRVERRQVKYPRIEFKAMNELLVILPLNDYNETEFLNKKQDWISKKLTRINKALELVKDYREHIRDKMLFLGKFYDLIKLKGKDSIELEDNIIKITTPTGILSVEYLKNWLKIKLKQIIISFLDKYSKELGIPYNEKKVIIRLQQTKWASCSSKNYLNFNLKLIILPIELIEYVTLHEIIHLTKKSHDLEFWKMVSKYFSNYQEIEMKLLGFWFLIEENHFWNQIKEF